MTELKWLRRLTFVLLILLSNEALTQDSPVPSGESDSGAAVQSSASPADKLPMPPVSSSSDEESETKDTEDEDQAAEAAWEYDPYRVLIWIVSDDSSVSAKTLDLPLRTYLDRDFAAVWQTLVQDAPVAIQTEAIRNLGELTYDRITAADPVIALKRDHVDAVRIRIARNVGEHVKKVHVTQELASQVKQLASAVGNPTLDDIEQRLAPIDGDAMAVRDLWTKPDTEAILVSRGMASGLTDPQAKLITPTIAGQVAEALDRQDKVFVVRITTAKVPAEVSAVEFDTLMRHFGPVATVQASITDPIHVAVGRCLTQAFAPVVRIENAGLKNAVGLLRAGGLILEKNHDRSPAFVRVGDVLEPMTRKNDRNGDPILIGRMDWSFLRVNALSGHGNRNIEMDFYAGRAGGLQGRKNQRTFRTALKVRPFGDFTTVRLHLQRDPGFPLIGYELYDKDLATSEMTFLGRTDWNGRFRVERTDQPLRMLYVKNGGAVLARLPLVPGLYPDEVADLTGDDIRLQAEAYIRGVQNSIVDLVAIRELFKARILLRLERGEIKEAEDLLNALRNQPSNESLYDDIGKKQTVFLNQLGSGNSNQRRKVDEMFTTTRELLAKHITPKLVRDMEEAFMAATKNGGKLPVQPAAAAEETPADSNQATSAEQPPAATPGAPPVVPPQTDAVQEQTNAATPAP